MMEQTTTQKDARPSRRRIIGVVRSDKGDQTIKVVVNYLTRHPLYGKFLRRRTTVHAHDPANDARLGDTVEVAECRPISKTKTWRLVRVIERASQVTA